MPGGFQDKFLPWWCIFWCPFGSIFEHGPEWHKRKDPDKHVVMLYPVDKLYTLYDIMLCFCWQSSHHGCNSEPAVVVQNSEGIIDYVWPILNSVGLDLAGHDIFDKPWAYSF